MAKEKLAEDKSAETNQDVANKDGTQTDGPGESGSAPGSEARPGQPLPAVKLLRAHVKPARRTVVCVNCGKEANVWKTKGNVSHRMCNHCGHNWTGQVSPDEADPLVVLARELVIELKRAVPLRVPGCDHPVILLSVPDATSLIQAIEEEIGVVKPLVRRATRDPA